MDFFHFLGKQLEQQWVICEGGHWPPLRLRAPQDPWQRRKAGRKTAAPPLPVQAQPAWRRIKETGPWSQRSDPISALPAGLLGPPAPSREARFTSFSAMGDLALNAQLGNRDAVQTPPWEPLKSSFRRCQFAADFDPIVSRLGPGQGLQWKASREEGPRGKASHHHLSSKVVLTNFGVSTSLRKLHRN